MTTRRALIGPAVTVAQAAKMLLATGEDTLWVCEGGRILGVVTKQDLLRAYVRHFNGATTCVEQIMEGQEHFASKHREHRGSLAPGLSGLVTPDHGRWS
ncbi:MAG: hypothetical protein R6V12_08675 [Candidatus Hydrogenedentota bacterium]